MDDIVEISEELLIDIKEEIEEPVEYTLPEEIVTACLIDFEDPSVDDPVNQFCRLCLREQTNLVPLMSRIKDVTLPIMIQSITGIVVNLKGNLPKKLCIDCVKKLDYAFNIQREFIENDKNLKLYARSRVVTLVEQLQRYQKGLLATTETYAEKLYREQRDAIRLKLSRQEDQSGDIDAGESSSEKTFPESMLDGSIQTTAKSVPRQKKDSNKRVFNGFIVEVNETELDPNKCYICEHVTASNEELKVHLRSHADMVPYDCQQCSEQEGEPMRFTSVILLQRHFRMHAGSIKCPQCPFWTNTAQKLWAHTSNKHADKAKTNYVCDICGLNLVGSKHLNRHKNAHKAVEMGRYQCSICQKNFSQKSRLERHVKTHSNESPYDCQICEKKYKSQESLNAHMRTHSGEFGHRCELCGKGFQTKMQLTHHMNAHNNIRPFTCEICGESFVREGTLRNHRMKHSETLQYQCRYCEKKFRYEADRYKHERSGCANKVVIMKQEDILDGNITEERMEVVEQFS